jgi:hypothetical protein
MTDYTITLNLSPPSLNTLLSDGYALYGCKAVKTTAQGAPLVWFQRAAFADTLAWSEQYAAYTSGDPIIPNYPIVANTKYDLALGETLNIVDTFGDGTVVPAGTSGAISLNNQTTTLLTGGLWQPSPSEDGAPVCACSLGGGQVTVITPLARVLLFFAPQAMLGPGTVIEMADMAYGDALLIDLTDAPARAVIFDVNSGWSWGGGSWARVVSAGTPLGPLLFLATESLHG